VRSRAYFNKFLGQIAQTIASEHGLGLSIDPALASVFYDDRPQTNVSDSAFLHNLILDLPDAYYNVAGGKIIIGILGATAAGPPAPNYNLSITQVIEFHATFSLRSRHSKVKARYHDQKTGETKYVEVVDPNADEDSTTELPFETEDEDSAKRAAGGELRRIHRGAESVTIRMIGDAQLHAGRPVTLSGFRRGVDKQWLAIKVEHGIDNDGFITELEVVHT